MALRRQHTKRVLAKLKQADAETMRRASALSLGILTNLSPLRNQQIEY